MWTRVEIKTRAKAVLKESYWKAFLVSIIMVIVGANQNGSNFRWNINDKRNTGYGGFVWRPVIDYIRDIGPYVIPIVIVAIGVTLLILCLRIFIGYSIEVGGRRYFVRSAQGDADLNNIGYSFSSSRYINIIKVMLYKGVLIFLWSLLLIIPGIVKAYAYRMVPYILADNPQIGYKRAIEISNGMTYDEKFNIFALDVSFLGWYILGAIAFGVGILFVNPYVNATDAELYLVLRQKAINNGVCSQEELMIDESIK